MIWFNLFENYDCSQLESFPQVGVEILRKTGNHDIVKNDMQTKNHNMVQNSLTLPKKRLTWTLQNNGLVRGCSLQLLGFLVSMLDFEQVNPIFAAIFSNSRFNSGTKTCIKLIPLIVSKFQMFFTFQFTFLWVKTMFFLGPPIFAEGFPCHPRDGAPRWRERVGALAPSFRFFRGFRRRPQARACCHSGPDRWINLISRQSYKL